MTVFGDKAFEEVTKSKWLCSCKKRRLGHRQTQRANPVRTQREDGHLQVQERDSEGAIPSHASVSRSWPSEV